MRKVTELLRRSIFLVLTLYACADCCTPKLVHAAHPSPKNAAGSMLRLVPSNQNPGDDIRLAQQQEIGETPNGTGYYMPDDPGLEPIMTPVDGAPRSLDDYANQGQLDNNPPDATESESRFSKLSWLGLHHSSLNGRNVGMGEPLVGTSWLNRPYYVGFDYGTLWVTQPPIDEVRTDTDFYGGLYAGCELDYYWGVELSVQRATPELVNLRAPNAVRGDREMIWTANLMYYPWGDAWFRPYWRTGIGGMAIDFPNNSGVRLDETLWAFPIGVGMKWPLERWLAARAELTDQIGIGNSGIDMQHDLTFTFALEWRLGARPRSYWPWNPSRHIW
jgi:hypothetical protein